MRQKSWRPSRLPHGDTAKPRCIEERRLRTERITADQRYHSHLLFTFIQRISIFVGKSLRDKTTLAINTLISRSPSFDTLLGISRQTRPPERPGERKKDDAKNKKLAHLLAFVSYVSIPKQFASMPSFPHFLPVFPFFFPIECRFSPLLYVLNFFGAVRQVPSMPESPGRASIYSI